ncbi:MAG: DnaJ C-terminal domain-containing protein [bacterium]|jgi:curved DNA-binding protein
MKYKDYYKSLGLARGASDEDIKKAYRRLARQYHPDVSKEKDAEERFKEIAEAYETLKDPQKRAAYDGLGAHRSGEQFRPPPDWFDRFHVHGMGDVGGPGGMDLADLFATFSGFGGMGGMSGMGGGRGFQAFGGRGGTPRHRGSRRGADVEASVQLALEDVTRASEVSLQVGGQSVRVRIPRGTIDGQRLRLRGKGAPGIGAGPAGDLYLTVGLRPHPRFRAEGHDLSIEVPLAPWEAALGAAVEIPTLDSRVTLKIPAGSKSGQRLRLSGLGLPKPVSGAGDLYAVLSIALPATLSARERELYEQLREASQSDPRAHLG